jgi:hypothetical protein
LHHTGEELGASAHHRLDEHRQTDPLDRRSDIILPRKPEGDARPTRTCARRQPRF